MGPLYPQKAPKIDNCETLTLREDSEGNFFSGVYRFFWGIFVKNASKKHRYLPEKHSDPRKEISLTILP